MMKYWKPILASVQGTKHIERNISNQDVVYSYEKNGIAISVVADGAGSKEYSLEGATIFCETISKYLVSNFTKIYNNELVLEVKQEIIETLLAKLERKVKKYNCTINDFASTLLFVCVKEDKQYIAGHIGDGCICVKNNKTWSILSEEVKEDAINLTQFVTSRNAVNSLRLYKGEINDVNAFSLMSDGVSSALINKDEITNGINVMNNWILNNDATKATDSIINALETKIKKVSNDDLSLCYLTKVKYTYLFDSLLEEEKISIFEKHYTHIYNVMNALNDANEFINVLRTTNASLTYITKRSKVKSSTCQKIADILLKTNIITFDGELYSLAIKETNE